MTKKSMCVVFIYIILEARPSHVHVHDMNHDYEWAKKPKEDMINHYDVIVIDNNFDTN